MNNKITISYFRAGFGVYETNKQGGGVFFAISKKEFGVWKREDKSDWKREKLWNNSQEKIQSSKTFLSSNKDTLLTYFDAYVFYIKQNDLVIEGSYMTDDGQLRDNYSVKDNAIIYIYKYENNTWININQEKLNGKNTRTYGQDFLEKILRKRFGNP